MTRSWRLLLAQHSARRASEVHAMVEALLAACRRDEENTARALLFDAVREAEESPAGDVVVPFDRSQP